MRNIWSGFAACVAAQQIALESGVPDQVLELFYNMNNDPFFDRRMRVYLQRGIGEEYVRRFPEDFTAGNTIGEEEYIHLFGKAEGIEQSQSNNFFLVSGCHKTLIGLDDKSLVQKYGIRKAAAVHVFAEERDDGPVARFVVTAEALETVRYFTGTDHDKLTLRHFLHLPEKRQETYVAMAHDPALCKGILYAAAYFASDAFARGQMEMGRARRVLEQFNRELAPALGCGSIEPKYFAVCAQDLFGRNTVDLSRSVLRHTYKAHTFLMLVAVTRGFSAWQQAGESAAQVIIDRLFRELQLPEMRSAAASFICRWIPGDLRNGILEELLDRAGELSGDKYDVDMLLYDLLCKCTELEQPLVQQLCEYLFRDTIYQTQIGNIKQALTGPNGVFFRKFIMDGYASGCENRKIQYQFCAAAITIHDQRMQKVDPVMAAVEGLQTAEPAVYLLHVTSLGLLVWNSQLSPGRRNSVRLKLLEHAVKDFVDRLCIVDTFYYPVVACTVSELIISGVLDVSILNDTVRETAIRALGCTAVRKRAEELLTLLPISMADGVREEYADLRTDYLAKYHACVSDPQEGRVENMLAVACHLGAYPTDEERQQQLERIMDRYERQGVVCDHENKWCFGHLLKTTWHGCRFWETDSTDVDPMQLDVPLPALRQREIQALIKELARHGRQHDVTDSNEALEFVKYLQYFRHKEQENSPELPLALRHLRLVVPNPGSYIVVSWFYMLCRYGEPEQALCFYRMHSKVLDRPASIWAIRISDCPVQLYQAFRIYRAGTTRLFEGLYMALRRGNVKLLETFMEGGCRQMLCCDKFLQTLRRESYAPVAEYIDRVFGEQYRWRPYTLNASLLGMRLQRYRAGASAHPSAPRLITVEETESKYLPEEFYDDRTVLRYNILKNSQYIRCILDIGYSDDDELVKLAVSVDSETRCYASLRMQNDPDIAAIPLESVESKLSKLLEKIKALTGEDDS